MKLAVTSQGPGIDSPVDPRFGRAKYFLLIDTDSGQPETVDNSQLLNAAQGAGIQAGKKICDLGAEALVTGHIGPNAFSTLHAGQVKVYTGASGTVAEAVEQFRAGKLDLVESPDVEGHWV